MSHRYRQCRSTARQIAWYLTALAAVGVVAIADELLRHGLLTALALVGPAIGYAVGWVHGRRLRRRRARRPQVRHQAAEDLEAERDSAGAPDRVGWEASTRPGLTRARLLADPRSGVHSLDSPAHTPRHYQ